MSGADLSNLCSAFDSKEDQCILQKVYVLKNPTCLDRVETSFYSYSNFNPIYVHCATDSSLVSVPYNSVKCL